MFSNVINIITRIQTDLQASIPGLLPTVTITLDQPLEPVYTDLPAIYILPTKEEFIYEDSTNNEDKKKLHLAIICQLQNGPASTVATPILNAVVTALKADRTLGGDALYVEFSDVVWATDDNANGTVCGFALDMTVDYFIS